MINTPVPTTLKKFQHHWLSVSFWDNFEPPRGRRAALRPGIQPAPSHSISATPSTRGTNADFANNQHFDPGGCVGARTILRTASLESRRLAFIWNLSVLSIFGRNSRPYFAAVAKRIDGVPVAKVQTFMDDRNRSDFRFSKKSIETYEAAASSMALIAAKFGRLPTTDFRRAAKMAEHLSRGDGRLNQGSTDFRGPPTQTVSKARRFSEKSLHDARPDADASLLLRGVRASSNAELETRNGPGI